nr:ribonuclease H-like domain-containing protein [Tanacetum cinerariifolium]
MANIRSNQGNWDDIVNEMARMGNKNNIGSVIRRLVLAACVYYLAGEKFKEVILNGDSPPPTRSVDGVEKAYPPTTAYKKLDRKNKFKARGTLLMALPNEHQLKFNSYESAKSLMEVIEKRFGGNKESKKVQKTLLKQYYENFNETSSEGLNQIYDRLQKHINLETLSMDDLYNNLKIYEAEVMRGDRLEVADGNVNHESHKIPTKDMKESRAPKHQDNRNREAPKRTVLVEDTTSNDLVSQCNGLGYDWSDQAKYGPTNFALMAYTYSSSSSSDSKIRLSQSLDRNLKNLKKRDDLKLTLEKFEGSSKNLSRLLDSQQCDESKTGLGYDSQGFDIQVSPDRNV